MSRSARSRSDRPRLLVLGSTFPAHTDDGVPAFVLDLAHQESTEFDTLVLTPRVPGGAVRERIGDVAVRRFPYFPRRFEDLADGAILDNLKEKRSRLVQVPALVLAQYLAVRQVVRSARPDVIHAHWAIPQALVAALAAPGVPLVVTTHGGDVYALRAAPLVRLKRWVFGRSAHVTTVNSEMADRLGEWGVPAEQVSVIPMGVDLGPAQAAADDAAAAGAAGAAGVAHVVAVGRLVEKKGFGNLLDALRGLGDDVPWRLTIVGDGPWRSQLEQQASGLPVTFTGQRGRSEVLAALASATVVAVPSVPAANGDQEGLPVTLLEAAAVGAAIVASDLPGIREVVHDDDSGLLVAPGAVDALRAALRRVLTDDDARARYRERAAEVAAEFSTERIGERYRAVLREAVARGR